MATVLRVALSTAVTAVTSAYVTPATPLRLSVIASTQTHDIQVTQTSSGIKLIQT